MTGIVWPSTYDKPKSLIGSIRGEMQPKIPEEKSQCSEVGSFCEYKHCCSLSLQQSLIQSPGLKRGQHQDCTGWKEALGWNGRCADSEACWRGGRPHPSCFHQSHGVTCHQGTSCLVTDTIRPGVLQPGKLRALNLKTQLLYLTVSREDIGENSLYPREFLLLHQEQSALHDLYWASIRKIMNKQTPSEK